MAIDIKMGRSRPGWYRVKLGVEVSGAVLTVRAGTVIIDGVTYTLAADQTFTMTQRAYACMVLVYLAKNTSTNQFVVIVDDVVRDGVDTAFSFQSTIYQEVHMLAVGTIPANAANLATTTFMVWHMDDVLTEPSPANLGAAAFARPSN
jgi:hypothetical protein